MKRLTCEMCGSTDLIKQDGVFVCQSCGCKYSVEEARKMMFEGTVKIDNSAELQSLLKRAYMFLEDGEWNSANEYCEKVLDIDPKNVQAYLCKLLAQFQVKRIEQLKDASEPFDNNNYKKLLQFADLKLRNTLISYLEFVDKNINGSKEVCSGVIKDKSAKNVIIPYGVTTISREAFYKCTSLTSVTIPNTVTTIEDGAFSWCSSLTSITIPNSVTTIGSLAFSHCLKLTSITIPDSVTTIGSSAFSGCKSLNNITISNNVTKLDSYAFSNCESLSSITIPKGVTEIGWQAFEKCKSLTSISIPNSVTEIGSEAFYYCTSLNNVIIPNSVTKIGSNAFFCCTSLTNIVVPNIGKFYEGNFRGCPFVDIRRKQGVCLNCGGEFKGLFTKKCEKCGQTKDY